MTTSQAVQAHFATSECREISCPTGLFDGYGVKSVNGQRVLSHLFPKSILSRPCSVGLPMSVTGELISMVGEWVSG